MKFVHNSPLLTTGLKFLIKNCIFVASSLLLRLLMSGKLPTELKACYTNTRSLQNKTAELKTTLDIEDLNVTAVPET